MPLDPQAEAAKRKAMSAVFEKTQREMASAVDELAMTRRLPVPYESNEPVPEVTLPYPQDSHLVRSTELVPKRTLDTFMPADTLQNPPSHGKPWASFSRPSPQVLSDREQTTAAPPAAEPATDEEMWRTRHNEWTLQKNAYNPDIASQMRCAGTPSLLYMWLRNCNRPASTAAPTALFVCASPGSHHHSTTDVRSTNVRKAAALTSAVKVDDAFSQQKALIASSLNVKAALTYSDVSGPAPKRERVPLKLQDVWPQGRVR